ncbi:hypothetical protein F0562_015602 [Nyssa sinensis]|uniref:Uncharacterized protein n=1 Tax=Nyssa sinensis TaxID=561372 RepID=A0A5J4ZKN6_9ASTE|nr:hypothetical protein F0562_015602 [Nyssa sinensis]
MQRAFFCATSTKIAEPTMQRETEADRRDKLRVLAHSHPGCVENLHGCAGLLPLYDPSLIPSDLLNCANLHHQNNPLSDTCKPNQNSACGVIKEKGVNLMGYVGGIINASSSSSTYLDPQSSIHINPGSIQEINSNPFLYTPQNLRIFDQSFNSGEVVDLVVFKPEAFSINHEANTNGQGLSLSLSSHHTHQNNLPLELNLQRYESSIFNDKVTGVGAGYIVPGWSGIGPDLVMRRWAETVVTMVTLTPIRMRCLASWRAESMAPCPEKVRRRM